MAAPSYVFTIGRVAKMLGEDDNCLYDIAMDMEPEDGCLTLASPCVVEIRPDLWCLAGV